MELAPSQTKPLLAWAMAKPPLAQALAQAMASWQTNLLAHEPAEIPKGAARTPPPQTTGSNLSSTTGSLSQISKVPPP